MDKDLELDSPIPEYCPDIARVVRVDCSPFAERCVLEDGKAIMQGKAVYDVLYETDYKSKLKCVSFTQDFNSSVAVPKNELENPLLFCKPVCERISCQLLGPRRILLKSTLNTHFELEGEQAVTAIEPTESKDVFFRKNTLEFQGKTISDSTIHRFDEEIPLNQGEKSIGEIVCGSIELSPAQIAVSSGKAEIRTNALFRVLCEHEDKEGAYYIAQKLLPINIDYQNKDIDSQKHIELSLSTQDESFSPELDQYGESRIVKTAFSVKADMKLNETKSFTVAEDMFEKDHDIQFAKTTVALPQLSKQTEANFSIEAKLPPSMPRPEILLDTSARAVGISVESHEDGFTVNGRFITAIMAKTSEGIFCFDNSIPFSQPIPAELPQGEIRPKAQVYPMEASATLLPDGSINIRIIAGAKINAYTDTNESFISEITKRTPYNEEDDGSALIYCFPNQKENLWDMAKRYRTDPEVIARENPESFDEKGNAIDNELPVLIKT